MSLNFPSPAVLNQTYDAPNGVLYVYDGEKWTIKVGAEDVVNYWTRNAVTTELAPKSFNDKIIFDSLGIEQLDNLPA